jgi:hypothetical protein
MGASATSDPLWLKRRPDVEHNSCHKAIPLETSIRGNAMFLGRWSEREVLNIMTEYRVEISRIAQPPDPWKRWWMLRNKRFLADSERRSEGPRTLFSIVDVRTISDIKRSVNDDTVLNYPGRDDREKPRIESWWSRNDLILNPSSPDCPPLRPSWALSQYRNHIFPIWSRDANKDVSDDRRTWSYVSYVSVVRMPIKLTDPHLHRTEIERNWDPIVWTSHRVTNANADHSDQDSLKFSATH